jgi:hypothetical protein
MFRLWRKSPVGTAKWLTTKRGEKWVNSLSNHVFVMILIILVRMPPGRTVAYPTTDV